MKKTNLLIVISSIILYSCFPDAKRDNPLDPISANFENLGNVAGKVTSVYLPYAPIAGVEIRLIPGYYGAVSDEGGVFYIPRVPSGDYTIKASKSGYAPDSASITVRSGLETRVDFFLDALPVFWIHKFSHPISVAGGPQMIYLLSTSGRK